MPEGISAQGTVVSVQRLGVGSFYEIKELQSVTPPAISRNDIEITSHNESWDAYIGGILRRSTLDFTICLLPDGGVSTNHDKLHDSIIAGDVDIWKVEYPDGSYLLTSGFINNIAPSAPVDDKLTADVSVRCLGTPYFSY